MPDEDSDRIKYERGEKWTRPPGPTRTLPSATATSMFDGRKLGFFCLTAAIIGLWLIFGGRERVAPHVESVRQDVVDPAATERCKRLWLRLESEGLLKGERVLAGRAEVLVNEALYRTLDYQAKVGLAMTLNCIVVGGTSQLRRIDFLSDMTNNPLAQWSYGRLKVM